MRDKYLAKACGKDDNFILFSHFLQKIIHTRAFNDVNVMPMVLNFDRDNIICLLDRLKDNIINTKGRTK